MNTSSIPSLRSRDGQLVNQWYIACLSRELKKDKPISRKIYDRSYVLFRGENGEASCLIDRCLHRATRLSEGRVCRGHLTCPYHGWEYNTQGEVTSVPSSSQSGKLEKGKFRIPITPLVEREGVIWIWTGDESPKGHPSWHFPQWQNHLWSKYFMITDFENEVTHLAENFMDVPHTVYVHKGWFRTKSQKPVPLQVEINNGQVLATYQQSKDSIGFTSRLFNPKNRDMIHTDCFIFPNLTRVDYQFGEDYGFIINSQITPVTTLHSRVYTYIAFQTGWTTRILYPFLRFYTRRVIEQDVVIMKNQGSSFREDFSQIFYSTQGDEIHLGIEKLRKMGITGDPNLMNYSKKKDTLFWI